MKFARIWAGALTTLCVVGGIVCTTTSPASAQESALSDAKDKAHQAPTSAEAALAYGRALRRAGRDGDALTELRRAQVFAKGDLAITTDWEIARTYIAKRDFHGAMNACDALKKLTDGTNAQHVCAAEAHLLWKRGTEAMGELALLGKNQSFDVQYYGKLADGRSRELDSKETDAEVSYRAAIQVAPNRSDAHVALGAMLYRIGKDGLPELRKAVEVDGHDPIAQYELGHALAGDARTHGEAITAFDRAIAERPTHVEALRAETELYVADSRLTDAKETAVALLKLAPNDVIAHVVSGRVALADGKTDDAIKEGELALKLMPNEEKAKLLVADAYAKKGEIDLALEAYQKASGLDPQDPVPLVNATNACIAANRVTSAKAFGARAVLDFPEQASAWIAQGDALVADGNKPAARKSYESALKARGADANAIGSKISRL